MSKTFRPIAALFVLLLLAAPAWLAAAETAPAETAPAETAEVAEATAATVEAASPAPPAFFVDFKQTLRAVLPGTMPISWEPPCNQGAYCRFDPSVCGPEGFCNQQSWCCMCY